jgi:uncharacterized membrane protein YgaE (UPF0421/DUF939 family)
MRMPSSLRAPERGPLLQVAKSAIATVAAWFIAGWLIQGPLPVFAAIAALLVVQPSLNQSFAKALERTVGVVIGVVVAALLGLAFGQATWVISLSVVVALLLAWLLRMTPGTSNQVAISAMLVLALGAATPGYALDRILETVIGAIIGFVVNIAIVPPVAVGPARDSLAHLGDELAASLDRLALALGSSQTHADLTELLIEVRLLRPMRDATDAALRVAEESLTLNPRARRHREELAVLRDLLDRFTPIVTQVTGMTRTFCDRYDPTLDQEPTVAAIAEQLRRAAHDVRLAVQRADLEPAPSPNQDADVDADEPALTRPLSVDTPKSGHWVLVGSLLVDLRRIHQTLRDEA